MIPDSPALLFFGGLFPGLPVLFGRRWFRFPKNGPYPVPIGRIGHQDEFFPEQILVLFHQVIPLVHVFYIVHPLEIIQAVPQIHGDVVGLGDFFLFLFLVGGINEHNEAVSSVYIYALFCILYAF